MSSVFCTSCGAPAPAGAGFCSYCGAALVAGRGAPGTPFAPPPLPASPPPMPPVGGGYPYAGAPPSRPRRNRWLVVAVIFVVVILVVGIAAFFFSASPAINVSGINFVSPDNACGLNGASDYGFTGNASQGIPFTYQLYNLLANNSTASCTIHNITTTTPGFSVTGANTPLTIPAGVNSWQYFSFQVNLPSSPYSGVLTLVIT